MFASASRAKDGPHGKTLIVVAFVFDLPYKAVRGAHHAGYKVHVLGQGTARAFRYSMACAGYRPLAYRPGHDPIALAVHEIRRHIRDVGACAVIPGDTIATRLLISVRDQLPVRTCLLPTAALFDRFNDKLLFFQYCRQIGIRVPDTWAVDGPDAVLSGLGDGTFKLPLVVKPQNAMGGFGVRVLRDERDLQPLRDRPHTLPAGRLLVQTFIDGTDRDMSLVARAGEVVAYAAHTARNRRYDLAVNPQLRAMAQHIVAASVFDGVANFDAVEETATGDCYMVECNPRFWFSMFALLAADLNIVTHSLAEDGSSDHPATATRPMVPLGRAAIVDFLCMSWTPALFAILRYYLRDIPGVLCGRLPWFQNRKPGPGDIPDQMRQLANLSRQTSAHPLAAE